MTRINPIIFAILVGLVAASVFYLFIYTYGPNRMQQIAIPVTVITAIVWFMAQRMAAKPRPEQFKQRMMAIGVMVLAIGAYAFADYKRFESSFTANCEKSGGSMQVCDCIERAVGPQLWSKQIPLRPEVALGKMSQANMLGQVNTENRDMVQAAARSCSR